MEILITPQEACDLWPGLQKENPGVQVLLTGAEVHDSKKLSDLLAKVDAAILGVERVDAEVLKDARRLKVISRFGVGFDAISISALKERGIRLTNTPGAMSLGVARHTLALVLAITSRLKDHWIHLGKNEWLRLENAPFGETTLGIVGMGHVGMEVARMALSLGFNVVAFSRSDFLMGGVARASSLESLIDESNLISLHLPLIPETRHLISGKILERMNHKSLINVSRGALVDETQILESLESGRLEYYGADVFEVEPLDGISAKLVRHPRVIATPHVAARDKTTNTMILKQALNNAIQALQGNDKEVKSYVL